MTKKPIIAMTMGDPGGIGPEIILKTLQANPPDGSYYLLLIGSEAVFRFASERLSIPFRFNPIPTLDQSFLRNDSVNLLDISDEADVLYEKIAKHNRKKDEVFDLGVVSLLNGTLAFVSIKVAAFQAACGLVQAVVTAPVHKEAIRLVESGFSGHTEYLAQIAKVKEFAMCFYSRHFCVTLVTIHVPLAKVSGLIKSSDIVSKIKLTEHFLKNSLSISKPRIAVAALNPHGREFGGEEKEVIEPAITQAKKMGINVTGPLPGDQIFHDAYQKRFDAVIAMYHDQGLAPFKLLAFDEGVNVTLGLPYIRTSPDHGTAFDIAYQNKANPSSFLESLQLAIRILLSK
ncbi:MAG: 4-hydroxythreonine-4-phosphate dehydrogenase PdxA [Candidatus Omnitrophica bacterium]|nr:4-hydroxythreonine-4-phosphate dehydrogenase PdxA [Candidatus Omnitrophota bacterium]